MPAIPADAAERIAAAVEAAEQATGAELVVVWTPDAGGYADADQRVGLLAGLLALVWEAARRFSEYWTFVRRVGCTRQPHDLASCPNCAAPVEVNQAGECAHCEATVTSGEFGWVLALIEQDDVYEG